MKSHAIQGGKVSAVNAFNSLSRNPQKHATRAPADFMTGKPCGEPQGSPCPSVRSANPHGAALPLAGESGSSN